VERVPPGTNLNRTAATQVRRVVLRRPVDGKRPLFLFDAGYDAVQLAQELGLASGLLEVAILVRLRSGRCFYLDPPPYTGRAPGRGGRPSRHGQKFTCDAPTTWWAPSAEHTTEDPRYGQVRVRAWAGVHGKVQEHADRGSRGPAPLERGTLVLLQVERLPRQTRVPKDVWLWWQSGQGPPGALPDLALLWRAYIHRFDVEHTFRFVKETLRWTAPRVRHPEQADRWTALVVLAYTQLRLAKPLVADQRLPWERPLRQERLTPGRVRRQFSQLHALLGTPAQPPQPCGHPTTRLIGLRYRVAPRRPAVKLTGLTTPEAALLAA